MLPGGMRAGQHRNPEEIRMKRFHMHVSVEDMERSVRFYSTLFGAEPVRTEADYAKWMLEDPRINFAISRRGAAAGIDHIGFQVDSADEADRSQGAAGGSRRRSRRGTRHGLLLREIGQVLGDRSFRHRMGDLPHAGLRAHVQWRGRRCLLHAERRSAIRWHLLRLRPVA